MELHFGARFVQGDGDAGGGHVPVLMNVHEAALAGEFQLIDQSIDDSDVGLMRDDTPNVAEVDAGFLERAESRVGHGVDGLFKYLFSSHNDAVGCERSRGFRGKAAGLRIVQMKKIRAGAVCPPIESQDTPRSLVLSQNDCPRAIPEKHARISISPVDHGGEAFGSNDEHISGGARP